MPLYRRVLGDAYARLPEPLRLMHDIDGDLTATQLRRLMTVTIPQNTVILDVRVGSTDGNSHHGDRFPSANVLVIEVGAGIDGQHVARDGDRRRVCGLTPIYTFLEVLGQRGKLLKYNQAADPNCTVTFASVVF